MLEKAVQTPINLIAERRTLYEHGIPEEGGIIAFEPIVIDANYDQVLVMMSPSAHNLKTLRNLIRANM